MEAERSVPAHCAAAAATARCEVAKPPARATVTLAYLQTFLRVRTHCVNRSHSLAVTCMSFFCCWPTRKPPPPPLLIGPHCSRF